MTGAGRKRLLLETAKKARLLDGSDTEHLAARLPKPLLTEAKRVSGITANTELLVYALVKVALEDDFGERLLALKGILPKDAFDADGQHEWGGQE